jgi:hypothetical protein
MTRIVAALPLAAAGAGCTGTVASPKVVCMNVASASTPSTWLDTARPT